jgi:hypothetical protein
LTLKWYRQWSSRNCGTTIQEMLYGCKACRGSKCWAKMITYRQKKTPKASFCKIKRRQHDKTPSDKYNPLICRLFAWRFVVLSTFRFVVFSGRKDDNYRFVVFSPRQNEKTNCNWHKSATIWNSVFLLLFPARHHLSALTSDVTSSKNSEAHAVYTCQIYKWYDTYSFFFNRLLATFVWFDYFLTFTVLKFIHDAM